MINEPSGESTYVIPTSMRPADVIKISRLIEEHNEFSGINVDIIPEREMYSKSQNEMIPGDEVLTILRIPCNRQINMARFFQEFSRLLNLEYEGGVQRERSMG
jgi:hypothetical protein